MKIRNGYVSNSSSSSFLIAYDPDFFGDLEKYFSEEYFGCETTFYNFSEDNLEEYKNEIEQAKKEGKQFLYFGLDQEYISIISLLKMINDKNGGNKIKFIYDGEELWKLEMDMLVIVAAQVL